VQSRAPYRNEKKRDVCETLRNSQVWIRRSERVLIKGTRLEKYFRPDLYLVDVGGTEGLRVIRPGEVPPGLRKKKRKEGPM